jgi:hypothetical protein
VELGHVFDGDFDAQVEAFWFAGVDDGDGAIDGRETGDSNSARASAGTAAAVISRLTAAAFGIWRNFRWRGVLLARLWLRRGSARLLPVGRCVAERPMRWSGLTGQVFKALDGEGQMRAAFCGDQGVDFVNDDDFDRTQSFARVGSEQQIERFRCGD